MSSTKPVIGVSLARRGSRIAWWLIAWRLWRGGGRPRRLYPGRDVEELHGLVLSGGGDIEGRDDMSEISVAWQRREGTWVEALVAVFRRLFARARPPSTRDNRERDEFELSLLARADREGIPVLGICRGAQLINIYSAGTLVDVSEMTGNGSIVHTAFPLKHVSVDPKSLLAAVLGESELKVNALHHQTINALGDRLTAVASDADGLIQAIESPRPKWRIGVQWHPEFLLRSRSQSRLFKSLIAEAVQLNDGRVKAGGH